MPEPIILTRTLDDEIARGALNLETGEFPMTLATEGEASDGHILEVGGAVLQPRMPLLLNHYSSDAVPALGSVIEPRKDGPRLRATGRVNLTGDDPLAATRRGVAQLISDGDLRAVSVRWEGIKSTPRTELPVGSPYYIDPGAKDAGIKRWGHLFSQWRPLEGSVVAIGADPKALIGRASTDDLKALLRAAFSDPGAPPPESVAAIEILGAAISAAREAGLSDADLANAVAGSLAGDLVAVAAGGATVMLPRAAWDQLRGDSLEDLRLSLVAARKPAATERREGAAPGREVPVHVHVTAPQRASVAAMPASDLVGAIETGIARAVSEALARALGRVK